MTESKSISFWTGNKLIVRLVSAADKIRHPENIVNYHIHPSQELILVKSGSLLIRYQERQWQLRANDFFAIPSSRRHQIIYLERDTHVINIMFRGTLFQQLAWRTLSLRKTEWRIAESVVRNASPPLDPIRCELLVAQLIALLCTLALRVNMESPLPAQVPVNKKLYKSQIVGNATDYIEAHCQAPLSLAMVAAHVGISTSHLRHLLLQETGCGFSVHLEKCRLEKVKKLIAESDANIKSISSECGFRSTAFFYKTFKRYLGMTPLEYARSLS